MKCEEARELFSGYLDVSMDEAASAVFVAHTRECASCRCELDAFRKNWEMLNALPEIETPVNFRHDVVMRVIRAQHEKELAVRERSFAYQSSQFLRKLVPSRNAIMAWGAILLFFVTVGLPQIATRHMIGGLQPGSSMTVEKTVQSGSDHNDVGLSSTFSDSSESVSSWKSRKVGRNTLWISITPKQSGDGRIVYGIGLSINQTALLDGNVCGRVAAEVHLLPANQDNMDLNTVGNPVWSGNVIIDNPVLVPVIIDRSQIGEGTVNLLVTWKYRGRSFAQIVYIPSRYRGSFARDMYNLSLDNTDVMKNRTNLYQSLQGISQDYGVVIVSNAQIKDTEPVIVTGSGSLQWMLRSVLTQNKLDWVMADHAIYVDRNY